MIHYAPLTFSSLHFVMNCDIITKEVVLLFGNHYNWKEVQLEDPLARRESDSLELTMAVCLAVSG